jgi:enoyl-CoA hydratase
VLHLSSYADGDVLVATIDRPARRNAVDADTLLALATALEDAVVRAVRVFVLRGVDGHFSAGADLDGVASQPFRAALTRTLTSLARVPLLTLAHIEGSCLGAGVQLATACDLRIAAPGAVFGVPAARLGVAVDAATIDRLTELIGGGRSRAMLLAAETCTTEAALAMGLINHIGDFDDALSAAERYASLAPLSITAHKVAFATASDRPAGAAEVQRAIDSAWASEDFAEGRQAFAEKRTPRFLGR